MLFSSICCSIINNWKEFPGGSDVKEYACSAGDARFDPWVRKIPWRRIWQPTPVFLPGKSHGWRSLTGYSPWGRKESDTTERLHFTLGRSPGEGNGNLLQHSCLENPMDGGAWQATVHGVANSRTRLSDFTHSLTHSLAHSDLHGNAHNSFVCNHQKLETTSLY